MFREQSQGISGVSFSDPSSGGACDDGIASIFPELHGVVPLNPHSNLGEGGGALPSLEVQKLTRPHRGVSGKMGAPAGWL